MECEFCKNTFKNKWNLLNHQKKAKYCLSLQQNKLDDNTNKTEKESKFSCKFCGVCLSTKQRLNSHIKVCNANTPHAQKIIEKYEKTILELKLQNERLETELSIYKDLTEKSRNTIDEIAKQPRVQQNTNNNQKILITSPMDLSQEKMKDMIENSFNANYMIQGQKGVAKFAYDTMLKDEEGRLKYICTDPSRQIFQYKNGEGEIQKDVKAKKLTKALLDGDLKSASHKIASDKMIDGDADDFLDYSTYYLDIRELEDDNSDFSKELSTLVI